MKNCPKAYNSSPLIRRNGLYLLVLLFPVLLMGQVNPPRPMTLTVSTQQSLGFGTFAITGSNGGTVTVSNTGIRTASGDIFLSGNDQSVGVFSIDVAQGTSLYMVNGLTASLIGNNGGNLQLTLGETSPALPYTTTSATTVFQIGGTLTVGPIQNNPPGEYYGTYTLVIVHE
jgi:hypothetical protein